MLWAVCEAEIQRWCCCNLLIQKTHAWPLHQAIEHRNITFAAACMVGAGVCNPHTVKPGATACSSKMQPSNDKLYAGLEPVAALLAMALDSSLANIPDISLQAVHLLITPDLLPLLAKPTDPEQVLLPLLPWLAATSSTICTCCAGILLFDKAAGVIAAGLSSQQK